MASTGYRTITSTSVSSILQFRPLQQSDNGSYSCNASIDGLTFLSEPVHVSVNGIYHDCHTKYSLVIMCICFSLAPSVSIQISDGGATPTAGQDYQLSCEVSGTNNINPTVVSYQWTKNSGGQAQLVGTNSNTLSFTPLQLSDASNYACTVIIASSHLTGNIVAMDSYAIRTHGIGFNIMLSLIVNQYIYVRTVPTLSAITLTSSSGNSGIQLVGSDVTLTCTVQLNSAVLSSEVSMLVVEVLLFRDGTQVAVPRPTVTGITFTYTTMVNSFGSSDSGNYTCTATVRPHSSSTFLTGSQTLQSNAVRIVAGMCSSIINQLQHMQ